MYVTCWHRLCSMSTLKVEDPFVFSTERKPEWCAELSESRSMERFRRDLTNREGREGRGERASGMTSRRQSMLRRAASAAAEPAAETEMVLPFSRLARRVAASAERRADCITTRSALRAHRKGGRRSTI